LSSERARLSTSISSRRHRAHSPIRWGWSGILVLWAVAAFPLSAQDFIAKCVGVTDGDTITVLVDTDQMKIRLEGIDAPERGQDFSSRAKQLTSGLVFGKQVHILPKEKDRYGRLVARVQVDGTDVSTESVKAGLAWRYKLYSSEPGLARAEQQSKAEGVGVWSLADPIPPWALRRAEGGTWTRAVSATSSAALGHRLPRQHKQP